MVAALGGLRRAIGDLAFGVTLGAAHVLSPRRTQLSRRPVGYPPQPDRAAAVILE